MKIDLVSKKKLNMFGKDVVKILTIMLKRAGKSNTGALINSLDYRLVETANEIVVYLESNSYLKYVDEGRKVGTWPNTSAIKKWVRQKGLPDSAAFPISRSIFKFGIKPTNVIDKTMKEITSSKTILSKLEEDIVNNVETLLVKQFENK